MQTISVRELEAVQKNYLCSIQKRQLDRGRIERLTKKMRSVNCVHLKHI